MLGRLDRIVEVELRINLVAVGLLEMGHPQL